uniref:Uncharacterized protein n=1 Tax=Megaselia scalaris TaxID=36166 RepID=T1GST2_MEGSC
MYGKIFTTMFFYSGIVIEVFHIGSFLKRFYAKNEILHPRHKQKTALKMQNNKKKPLKTHKFHSTIETPCSCYTF